MTVNLVRRSAEDLRAAGYFYLAAIAYERLEREQGFSANLRTQRVVCLNNASQYYEASEAVEEGIRFGWSSDKVIFILERYRNIPVTRGILQALVGSMIAEGRSDQIASLSKLNLPSDASIELNGILVNQDILSLYTYKDVVACFSSSKLKEREIFDKMYRTGLLHVLDNCAGIVPREDGQYAKVFAYWNTPKLPEEVVRTTSSWENLANEPAIYDEDRGRALLKDDFGQAGEQAFDRCFHPAMHSDLLRLAALTRHGGIYIDADETKVGRAADVYDICEMMGAKRLFVVDDLNKQAIVTNKSIYSIAGDDMMRFLTESIMQRCMTMSKEDANVGVITGPHAVTQYVVQYFIQNPDEIGNTAFVSLVAYNRIFRSVPMLYKQTEGGNWRNA